MHKAGVQLLTTTWSTEASEHQYLLLPHRRRLQISQRCVFPEVRGRKEWIIEELLRTRAFFRIAGGHCLDKLQSLQVPPFQCPELETL